MRFAMIAQLQNPSAGFEEIIRSHFRIQKARVLKQCDAWTRESTLYKLKFAKALEELKGELAKLESMDS